MLVSQVVLRLLIFHDACQPFGGCNKTPSVVRIDFLWPPSSGYEPLEGLHEFFSGLVAEQLQMDSSGQTTGK